MELRTKRDDRKIIAALICLFAGFIFIWNIAAHTADISNCAWTLKHASG